MPEVGRSGLRARSTAFGACALIAVALACAACGGSPSRAPPSRRPTRRRCSPRRSPPGHSAANLQFGPDGCTTARCAHRKRVMLRWVARHTGKLDDAAISSSRRTSRRRSTASSEPNGYGGGTSGTALVRDLPRAHERHARLLAQARRDHAEPVRGRARRQRPDPARPQDRSAASEFATVVRNVDPDPLTQLLLAQLALRRRRPGRGERPQHPLGDGAGRLLQPRPARARRRQRQRRTHVAVPTTSTTCRPTCSATPTASATASRTSTPRARAPARSTGPATMVFPRVPRWWTIRQLGAYTVAPGQRGRRPARQRHGRPRSATLSGKGMLRAPIKPITVTPGSTVKVRTRAGRRRPRPAAHRRRHAVEAGAGAQARAELPLLLSRAAGRRRGGRGGRDRLPVADVPAGWLITPEVSRDHVSSLPRSYEIGPVAAGGR